MIKSVSLIYIIDHSGNVWARHTSVWVNTLSISILDTGEITQQFNVSEVSVKIVAKQKRMSLIKLFDVFHLRFCRLPKKPPKMLHNRTCNTCKYNEWKRFKSSAENELALVVFGHLGPWSCCSHWKTKSKKKNIVHRHSCVMHTMWDYYRIENPTTHTSDFEWYNRSFRHTHSKHHITSHILNAIHTYKHDRTHEQITIKRKTKNTTCCSKLCKA